MLVFRQLRKAMMFLVRIGKPEWRYLIVFKVVPPAFFVEQVVIAILPREVKKPDFLPVI